MIFQTNSQIWSHFIKFRCTLLILINLVDKTHASNNKLAQPLSGANLQVFKNGGPEIPLTIALGRFAYVFELPKVGQSFAIF